MFLTGLFLVFCFQFSGALDSDILNKTDYFVIQGDIGYETLKWLSDWINIDNAKGMQDIINKTQQAQQTSQKLLPNYSSTVQSAWKQLQGLGQSIMNGTLDDIDFAPRARQIYSSLGFEDKNFFKNLFQETYGYSFDWIIGFMYDFLTNGMANGGQGGMMEGHGNRKMGNQNRDNSGNGQGGMMRNWNGGIDNDGDHEQ